MLGGGFIFKMQKQLHKLSYENNVLNIKFSMSKWEMLDKKKSKTSIKKTMSDWILHLNDSFKEADSFKNEAIEQSKQHVLMFKVVIFVLCGHRSILVAL